MILIFTIELFYKTQKDMYIQIPKVHLKIFNYLKVVLFSFLILKLQAITQILHKSTKKGFRLKSQNPYK